MTTKVVNAIKYVGILSMVIITLVSCEKEIESIGVNLIDNNKFTSDSERYEVETSTKIVDNVKANNLSQYLLGIYTQPNFGTLKASIVSQLTLPTTGTNYSYGENAVIDSVIVSIPYQSTSEDDYSDGKPKFSIDSVFGNTNEEFKVEIFELGTFLNTLDPTDPSKNEVHYSDEEFKKEGDVLYSGNFKVNANDTVSYIKRYNLDGITVFDKDTIKETNSAPSIKFPLNETIIKNLFVDNASSSSFASSDDFNHYFRGLYIEATKLNSDESHLISLSTTGAKMTIYYSENEDEAADEDLNDNDIKGEKAVRTKHNYKFLFGSLKSNILLRDDTSLSGRESERLYVQGAAGSMGIIEISKDNVLGDVQDASKDWLITDANLVFYVDQSASGDKVPEQLFLYNYDENYQLNDTLLSGIGALGGVLERDDDGKPYKYVFNITEYIYSLKSDDALDSVRFGLKSYNQNDAPTSASDIIIDNYNWNPKGVVLYNHNISGGDKKVELEIHYTELNN